MAKWEDTRERFVGFFDIMGFKDRIFRHDHDEILKIMEEIHEIIDAIDNYARDNPYKNILPKWSSAIVRPVMFSDAILVVSEDDSESSLVKLMFSSSFIIGGALRSKIPIKGALAYGKQTADFDKSLHFGKPLIDAYKLQDELQMYGAVLHHTVEGYLREHGMLESLINKHAIFKSKVPFKKSSVNHYCLNWNFMVDDNQDKRNEILLQLYDTVSGSTRHYVDNTLEFVNAIEASKPKK